MVQLAIMIVSFVVVVWFIGILIVGVDTIYLAPGRERKAAERESDRKPKKSVEQMMLEAEFPNHNWDF